MHMKQEDQEPQNNEVSAGIDLNQFYMSVEWDILDVPARKNEEFYPCCLEPFPGNISTN